MYVVKTVRRIELEIKLCDSESRKMRARDKSAGLLQHYITVCLPVTAFVSGARLLSRVLLQQSQPWDTSLCGVTLIGLDWTEVTIVGQHVPCQARIRTHKLSLSPFIFWLNVSLPAYPLCVQADKA